MVKSKIDFHSLENHSEGEHSGQVNHSEERLRILRKLDADLKAFIEAARSSRAKLQVEENIEIPMAD
jgi:hypothetical protein